MKVVVEGGVLIRVAGDVQHPLLVLLHGWGMTGEIFDPIVSQLSERFRVVIPDLPGLGQSEPALASNGLTLAGLSRQLFEALTPVLTDKAMIVGWSLGGNVAVQLAADYPENITGAILVASNPCFVERPDWPTAMPESTYQSFFEALQENPDKVLQRFALLQVKGDPNARVLLTRIKKLLSEAAPAQLSETLRLLACDNRPVLHQLQQPILHVLGTEDTLVPIALREALAESYPHHQIRTVDQSAHLPFLSNPDQFVQYVWQFAAQCQCKSVL